MAERKRRGFDIATPTGTKNYFDYTGQSNLPPLLRKIESASETQKQFLEKKYPGDYKEYPPYVLVFSPRQNGFFLLDTRNKKLLNQVYGNPNDLCEIVGDVFWPPMSEEEKKQGLSCLSLIPKGSAGKLGNLQKEMQLQQYRNELAHLHDILANGIMPPEYVRRMIYLEDLLR
jgi:hypothetical protein